MVKLKFPRSWMGCLGGLLLAGSLFAGSGIVAEGATSPGEAHPPVPAAIPANDETLPLVDLNSPDAATQMPAPAKPSAVVAPPVPIVPMPTAEQPQKNPDGSWVRPPLGHAARSLAVEKDPWTPPFVVLACTRVLDLSRIWWSPEQLSLRIGKPNFYEQGSLIPWLHAPNGYPAAILAARLETIENKEIVIKQAISIVRAGQTWVVEGSAMVVTMEKGGKVEEIIRAEDGKGFWRVRLSRGDTVEVGRWTASALNGCRRILSESLNNEELRQLLMNSGDVIWRIAPRQA